MKKIFPTLLNVYRQKLEMRWNKNLT